MYFCGGQFGNLISLLQVLQSCVEVPLLPLLLLLLLHFIPLLKRLTSERGPGKREEEQGARGDKLK